MLIAAKLDELGRPAWILLVILGFIVWWPLGLAALAFMIGSGRMGCWNHRSLARWQDKMDRMQDRMQDRMERMRGRMEGMGAGQDWWGQPRSSGNRAFDEYRTETLHRLEEEQREFQ